MAEIAVLVRVLVILTVAVSCGSGGRVAVSCGSGGGVAVSCGSSGEVAVSCGSSGGVAVSWDSGGGVAVSCGSSSGVAVSCGSGAYSQLTHRTVFPGPTSVTSYTNCLLNDSKIDRTPLLFEQLPISCEFRTCGGLLTDGIQKDNLINP